MTGGQWAQLLGPLVPAVAALILAWAAHLKARDAAAAAAEHAAATHDQVHPYPPEQGSPPGSGGTVRLIQPPGQPS